MSTLTPTMSIALYFTDANSNKEYHCSVEPAGHDLYVVNFQYGRRGSTLTAGSKTTTPVSLAQAVKIYTKLVQEKTAKGYSPGEQGVRYQQTEKSARVTGLLPQLLTSLDDDEVEHYLVNHFWAQEKHNGRRVQIRKRGNDILGSNKLGLSIALPETIVEAVRHLTQEDLDLDGESVNQSLRCFDLLWYGSDLTGAPYRKRYRALQDIGISETRPGLRLVSTAYTPTDKRALLQALKEANAEGLVFKDPDALYSPGRPSRGGAQLKYKFLGQGSFIVLKRNVQRSVQIGLLDAAGQIVPCGNVTIPPNKAIPEVESILDVHYLYAMASHKLHQPIYDKPRDDVRRHECRLSQLKYQPVEDAETDE